MKRRLTEREGRRETRFIWVMLGIIAAIIAMALYGYISGAWEETPL